MPKFKKIDAFQLKLFMATLMVFDHIHYIPHLISNEWITIFHVITRCVGVWFAYIAVEGFVYTRDKLKYNFRLFIWAAIMGGGNMIINYLVINKNLAIHNNIFLTLACGVLILNILFYTNGLQVERRSTGTNKLAYRIIGAILISLVGVIFTEGGILIIPFMVLTYIFREKFNIRILSYFILSLILFLLSFSMYDTVEMTVLMMLENSDWMFITVIPFMLLYSGSRGLKNQFSKYFFYIFYPMHLWIIIGIAFLCK